MTFTDEQFERLAPFEHYFLTITRSNYAGYVGYRNAERIHAVLKEAGLCSPNHRTNYTCAKCVMDLLRKAGKPWLADKEERAALAAQRAAQEAQKEAAAPTPAPTVKAARTATKSKTAKTAKK